MAYIGRGPVTGSFEKQTLTADGSTVTYNLDYTVGSSSAILVSVSGVLQEPEVAYNLASGGSQITFTAAPESGETVFVVYLGIAYDAGSLLSTGAITGQTELAEQAAEDDLLLIYDTSTTSLKKITKANLSPVLSYTTRTATGDASTVGFTVTSGVTVDDVLVTENGVLQQPTTDYTVSGTTLTFGTAPASGVKIVIRELPQQEINSSMTTKITDANIDSDTQDNNAFNISLLGFKMAVNEGLTVFNLVDGVVDEFNDESGTDEAEGSNDNYCATCDFYKNANDPVSYSAGFTTTSVTEPDTSTAGTNPTAGSGTFGSFCVPACMTSVNVYTWGAGGASQAYLSPCRTSSAYGGGGGFSSGILGVTPGQTLGIVVGEGGQGAVTPDPNTKNGGLGGGGGEPTSIPTSNDGMGGAGGGLSGAFNCTATSEPALTTAPQAYIVAGGGGGSGLAFVCQPQCRTSGGQGGGSFGLAGSTINPGAQTSADPTTGAGGGGSQTVGGSSNAAPEPTSDGSLFNGGSPACGQSDQFGAGGGGYYGGGSGAGGASPTPYGSAGGGGSGYIAHPQITCGSFAPQATGGTNKRVGAGVPSPLYVPGTNEGAVANVPINSADGEDGYVLLTATVCGSTTSTTIVSTAFTSTSVPTTSRIVVFEEDVDTPTLNTDVIASISRDGGTTFTNATLADSGYVTGSSGQRILTGQADISGQPSGQSMRWKLALANNTVKIHGVSLQWS